jgi:uncharacterized Zn ribbon protein
MQLETISSPRQKGKGMKECPECDDGYLEYDEDTGTYYCPECGYEQFE